MRNVNPTMLALIGGVVILLLVIAFFASTRDPDQDKLGDNAVVATQAAQPEKRCSSQATYDLIKRELFRRAGQLRGSDQTAFDRLAAYAVIRMENPVMESEDSGSGAVNCSGSLSLDLPPGVVIVGGRRTLMSDIDYTLQRAADGTGDVLLLKNADAIIAPLATLAKVAEPQAPAVTNEVAPETTADGNAAASESASAVPGPATSAPGRPSFDCSRARTSGERAVCADSGLSALDLNMATQYRRSIGSADPEQRQLLQTTRDRFLAYRDRCPNRQCIADAYVGRMREIRDIMEDRWRSR
jgi:hypothetical protein